MHPGYQNPDYIGEAGPVDSGLTMLSLQSADGKHAIGLLTNYSMHYFGTASGFSADYYGRFCDVIEKRVTDSETNGSPNGIPFVAAMSQGTSGDLHWMDYSRPKKQDYGIEKYTTELADIAWAAFQKIDYTNGNPELGMTERTLTLGRRLPSPQRIAWARQINTERGDRRPGQSPRSVCRTGHLVCGPSH